MSAMPASNSAMSIWVNGVEIPESAVYAEMQYHPAASFDAALYQACTALVVRELLLQEAHRGGVEAVPQDQESREEALIRELLAQKIQVPEPDDDNCRRFFENNTERFRSDNLYEVSHILLAAAPDDLAARDEARLGAEALIAQLAQAPARFAELAKLHSACPSKDVGGSLGQIGKGQTVMEFERVLERLPAGELCGHPVETRYGFHVVYLHNRIEGRSLPYELARDQIANYLRDGVYRRALSQYLQLLAGRADISGIDLPQVTTPLVQ